MFARLFLLFVTVPLVELYLFLVIGGRIGIFATFAFIFLTAALGAALARSQGLRTLQKYRSTLAEGRLPHDAILDGFMILVAGALLLTPGFLTDGIGFALLAPAFRQMLKKRLERSLQDRFDIDNGPVGGNGKRRGFSGPGASDRSGGDVITVEAEIIESHPCEEERPSS